MHYTQSNYIVSKLGTITNYVTCNSTLLSSVTMPLSQTLELRNIVKWTKCKITTHKGYLQEFLLNTPLTSPAKCVYVPT
jgi:hypothetical protein